MICGFSFMFQNFVCENYSYDLGVGIGIWMFENWVGVVIVGCSVFCCSRQDPLWSRSNSPKEEWKLIGVN